MTDLLYLEDLYVGQRFTSAEHALDVAQVKSFASQFDPQPFHLDEEAAKDSLFGKLAASGWHTAAITMRLMATGGIPLAGGLIGANVDVTWPKPTYPGDTLRLVTEVLEINPSRSRPDRGMITVRITTLNQRDEVAQDMKCRMLAFSRPAAEGAAVG